MTASEFSALIDDRLNAWHRFLRSRQLKQARSAAQDVIDVCKKLLDSVTPNAEGAAIRNASLGSGILFRGLHDYCSFMEVVTSEGWESDYPRIEKAWEAMWDARQRLAFVRPYFNCDLIDVVLEDLRRFEHAVDESLGPGLYMSPDLLVDRFVCSICGADYRACSHVRGAIYNGVLCSVRPVGMQMWAVSLVENPKDPRCRAWPWKLKRGEEDDNDNTLVDCVIMTMFDMADFALGAPEGEA